MRIFLVDMENVPKPKGIEKLTPNDRLILFFSQNTPPMPMDTLNAILKTGVKLECKKVYVGVKDALDFQLVSYLGTLLSGKQDKEIIIISNDQGYDVVQKFWQDQKNIKIKLQPSISSEMVPDNKKNTQPTKAKVEATKKTEPLKNLNQFKPVAVKKKKGK